MIPTKEQFRQLLTPCERMKATIPPTLWSFWLQRLPCGRSCGRQQRMANRRCSGATWILSSRHLPWQGKGTAKLARAAPCRCSRRWSGSSRAQSQTAGSTESHRPDFSRSHRHASTHDRLPQVGFPHYTHHTMRHFFCSNCIEAGVDFKVIAGWLGHVDGGVVVAKTYGHLRDVTRGKWPSASPLTPLARHQPT